ncbi:MAG: four helix bundle protein [candidate division WOR-3 bacterium]|nr:MAG: four helix bundle protein [candidate division WOR-3 bacterium]
MVDKIRDYKDLKVWQKALEVACDVLELVDMLPAGPARDIIGKQIIGSSTSVCANIAEGHSSGSSREYHRILKIAFREAKETDNWLQVIKVSRKFARPKIVDFAKKIEDKNTEVLKMLSSLRTSIKNQIMTKNRN